MNRGRHITNYKRIIYNFYRRYHRAKLLFTEDLLIKILDNQVRVGNKPDLEVFVKHMFAGDGSKGFSWSGTKEGYGYWARIMNKFEDL